MKKLKRKLNPDSGSSTPPTTEGQGLANKQGYVAQAELDLLSEGKRVSVWWNTGTNGATYPLVYITPAQFALKMTSYDNALTARIAAGTTRPMQTKTLADLDNEIDKALPQMRADIGSKFGARNRFAMYPQFGFIHYRDAWIFPFDRDDRKEAIRLCKEACIANGMTTIQYNAAWWTQMESDFNTALEDTQATDSTVSGGVALKNPLRDEVDKVLHSLYHIIRGNHPETYKQILRVAGFQKEDM